MPMYSVSDKIKIAKVSQYLCLNDIDKKGLFGGGVDLDLPNKIYNIRKSVEWLYLQSPDIPEIRAVGNILIQSLPAVGVVVTVLVDDPILGIISLGNYTVQLSDIDTDTMASHLNAVLATNPYGYTTTVLNSDITIEARIGLGSSINDNGRLMVFISSRIFDNSFDNTFN